MPPEVPRPVLFGAFMQHPFSEARRSRLYLLSLPSFFGQWACFQFVDTELYSSLCFFVDFACQKVLTLLPKNGYDLMPSIFILLSLSVLCCHSCLFILFTYLAFFYLFKLYA